MTSSGRPDLLLVGGSLWTAGWRTSRPGAVAVSSGRISAVGVGDDAAAVHDLAGPGTQVVDCAGRLVLPAFHDAHVHPVMGGLAALQCDLHGVTTAEQCLEVVGRYAGEHPELPWVLGGGWSMESFPGGTPTRQGLDAVVPDRPVLLDNRDGHGAWVNTAALQLAGVTATTPDPFDGRIEREPDGSPSGTLHEGAVGLVARHAPTPSADDLHAGLLLAQQQLFSLGITSWQDAAVGEALGLPDLLPVYLRAAASGELRAGVVGALWWDRERGGEQVPELVERRAATPVGSFRATSVKIMQDGVAENFTAGMTEPYLDACGHATANAGLSFVDPAALAEHVAALHGHGFQVHFHALGDRAVRECLDAVAAAVATHGSGDQRHHLAHLQVVHPDDVPRFASLGATANVQPFWAAHEPQMDELTIPFLGERRAAWQYPFGDLMRSGAGMCAGSDWPVSTADPLAGVHVAVNRVSPGATGDEAEPLYPAQALTLAQSLAAYTAGSARVLHAEDRSGRLAEGLSADLVVLDRDLFAEPPGRIAEASVVGTYLGGQLVHGG